MTERPEVAEALLRCTTQEWLKAHHSWAALDDVKTNPIARVLILQTAVRVGDGVRAKAMLAEMPSSLADLKFVSKIVADAEALIELQSIGVDETDLERRPLGRKLLERAFFLRALDVWSGLTDPAAATERNMRLAKILYRLGEYEGAAFCVEACSGTRFEERVAPLRESCEAGIQRVTRLEMRPAPFAAHPLARELRIAFAGSEVTPAHAALALSLGTLTGDWSDFLHLLHRSQVAGMETILSDLTDAQADDVAECLESTRFAADASPTLTDHMAKCCIRRGFYQLVDAIIDAVPGDRPPIDLSSPPAAAPASPPPVATMEEPSRAADAPPPAPKKRAPRASSKRTADKA